MESSSSLASDSEKSVSKTVSWCFLCFIGVLFAISYWMLGSPLPQVPGMPPPHLPASSGAHSPLGPGRLQELCVEGELEAQAERIPSKSSIKGLVSYAHASSSSIWSVLRQDGSPRRETHKPPEKSASRSCTFQKQSVFRPRNREMPTRKRCGLDFSVKQPRSV